MYQYNADVVHFVMKSSLKLVANSPDMFILVGSELDLHSRRTNQTCNHHHLITEF